MPRIAGLALILAGLALAGCGGEPAQQAETAPEGMPGVAAFDARLILPAVKGNPGALYFEITNNGQGDTAIAGAFVEGAGLAMVHTTTREGGVASMNETKSVPVAKGATVAFAPGGKHVMAMQLDEALAAGGTTEVTLTFEGGDKLSFPAAIRAAGDDR
jgi:hypothetical protein